MKFSQRIFGKILFVCACLATLLALLLAEENWRAKRAWHKYHEEHIARGEILDLQQVIPPAVPDGRNFAMTPLLKPLFEEGGATYNSDLSKKLNLPPRKEKKTPTFGNRLKGRRFDPAEWNDYLGEDTSAWLKKLDPELREISAAVRLPYSRFPVAYEKGFAASLPHVGILIKLAKLYALRACTELREGQTDAAYEDVQTLFSLGDAVEHEPFLISLLVRMAIYHNGLQVVWDGLEDHRWTDAQLEQLQGTLDKADLVKNLALALRGERAGSNTILLTVVEKPEMLPTLLSMNNAPGNPAWGHLTKWIIYRNMLTIDRCYQKYYIPSVDPVAHRIDPAGFSDAEQEIVNWKTRRIPNPCVILAGMLMPAMTSCGAKVGYFQTSIDEAATACALERYRLANGRFPETLEKLTPEFLKKIPLDTTDGEKLHYRLNNDGTYLLYSDGWNGKDDGGKVVMQWQSENVNTTQGDWVWSVKAAPAPTPKPAG